MALWRNLENAPEGFGAIFWLFVALAIWACIGAGALIWWAVT